MTLTADQVRTVRSTVPVLKEHGNDITSVFYNNMLREVPELNDVFNQANQANKHQATALAGALYAYASHIDDLGALSPALERICQKHASLYIRADQYETVGTYLLQAMGQVLGEALTRPIYDAWAAAYWQLAHLMIEREDELMSERNGWTDWRDFVIANKVRESEEITSFYLKPLDHKILPSFLPGQYVSVMMDVPKLKHQQSRQYSLSEAPSGDFYRISVKKETGKNPRKPVSLDPAHPGYVSNILHDIKEIGDVIKVSHPAGEFFLDPAQDGQKPIVLLAAGVGLTPMISILDTLIGTGSQKRISFIHTAKSDSAQAFGDHIRKVTAEHANITSAIFVKDSTTGEHREPGLQHNGVNNMAGRSSFHVGRLQLNSLDKVGNLLVDEPDALYFICGPDSFMESMRKELVAMGIDDDRVRMEVFGTGMLPK